MNLKEISKKLIKGKKEDVATLVKSALSKKIKPEKILKEGLISGMEVIGKKFKNNEIFIPEVLVSAKAMYVGLNILKPYLAKSKTKLSTKVVVGTVEGDIHDIGKNLVKMMLEGSGFEVIDLGNDVSKEVFYKKVMEEEPQLLCMSALLTTTMVVMKEIIEYFEKKGIRNKVKILVGGAPLTLSYAKKIGADGYAKDAASGAFLAKKILKIK
jgi:5-methyltetrahydrofolate--homocysteine methyltransferase